MSRVIRNISIAGNKFSVELRVDITDSSTHYVIDEVYPYGWKVTGASDDGSYVAHPGHIKWVVIEGAVDKEYYYEVEAPVQTTDGFYNFSGDYMFETDSWTVMIAGDSAIQVKNGDAEVMAKGFQQASMEAVAMVDQEIKLRARPALKVIRDLEDSMIAKGFGKGSAESNMRGWKYREWKDALNNCNKFLGDAFLKAER